MKFKLALYHSIYLEIEERCALVKYENPLKGSFLFCLWLCADSGAHGADCFKTGSCGIPWNFWAQCWAKEKIDDWGRTGGKSFHHFPWCKRLFDYSYLMWLVPFTSGIKNWWLSSQLINIKLSVIVNTNINMLTKGFSPKNPNRTCSGNIPWSCRFHDNNF